MSAPLLPDKEGDWMYIQAQYELGEKTPQQIGRETGVPVSKIYAVAARHEWVHPAQNTALAQSRAELRLAKEEAQRNLVEAEKEAVVKVNAEMQYRMLSDHRSDLGKARAISQRLMNEMTEMITFSSELKELGQIMRCENERGQDRQNDAYQDVISFPGKVKAFKTLTDAMKNIILLERQAFGVATMIEDPENPVTAPTETAIDTLLSRFELVLQEKSAPPIKQMGDADIIENGSS
jgi:hypothetical protein